MPRGLDIVISDPMSGEVLAHCAGPLRDGACPAVDAGDEVPCAGMTVAPAAATAIPYPVPAGSTGCPVSWAMALACSPDVLPE